MDPRYKSPTARVEGAEDLSFRNLEQLTQVLRWMLYAGMAFAAVSLVSSLMQLEMLSRPFTEEEGTRNDLREGAVGGVILLLTIATVIVFARWILLAHRNLPGLGARVLDVSPGWAVGYFFIPVINLWKPYQAMKSLWRYSHHVHEPDVQDVPWVLPVWWTLWIISNILGNVLMRLSLRAQTVEQFITATQITIINCLVDIVLNLVAAILVARIWMAQQRQHENPAAFAPPAGFADSPAT
jgi:hypothetical protein